MFSYYNNILNCSVTSEKKNTEEKRAFIQILSCVPIIADGEMTAITTV